MHRLIVNQILARFAAQNPAPATELRYSSTFELLIAVMLSAQATDVQVNKATVGLFAQANTPAAMLALGLSPLKHAIKSIGLYHTKAQHVIRTCELLVSQHSGQVPDTREALEALPGVGRKTANVVLNVAFGQPSLAVDTHVFRVANRSGMGVGKTPWAVEQALLKKIDAKYLYFAHQWLILHGRTVCVASKPHCPNCIIADLCTYPHKTTALKPTS